MQLAGCKVSIDGDDNGWGVDDEVLVEIEAGFN